MTSPQTSQLFNVAKAVEDNLPHEIDILETTRTQLLIRLHEIDLQLAELRTMRDIANLHSPEANVRSDST